MDVFLMVIEKEIKFVLLVGQVDVVCCFFEMLIGEFGYVIMFVNVYYDMFDFVLVCLKSVVCVWCMLDGWLQMFKIVGSVEGGLYCCYEWELLVVGDVFEIDVFVVVCDVLEVVVVLNDVVGVLYVLFCMDFLCMLWCIVIGGVMVEVVVDFGEIVVQVECDMCCELISEIEFELIDGLEMVFVMFVVELQQVLLGFVFENISKVQCGYWLCV